MKWILVLGFGPIISLGVTVISCGSDSAKSPQKSPDMVVEGGDPSADDPDAPAGKGGDGRPRKKGSGDQAGKKPQPGPSPGTPQPAPGSGSGAGPGGTSGPNGPSFFATTVKPIFQTMCVGCHADPRQPAEVRAPLSIYSYDAMRALLAQGGAPQDNRLWNLMRNMESHTGGDRCKDGPDASPCKEASAWWRVEFGATAGEGTPSLGRITDVTSLGRVYGYAHDPKNVMAAVTVTLYVDGPKGTGTMAGTAVANRPGDDGNLPGDHVFTLDLPVAMRNGKQREIFAYVTLPEGEQPLSSTSTKYTAYAFSQAGRDFYNANVQGRLGGCGGCHTISYEQQFYALLTPSPVKGGTATNNQLINKAAQTNGVSHGGGQSCGNANAGPCAEFQRWWQVEFGNQ